MESFSKTVKNEILQSLKEIAPCCELAFLAGFVRAGGSVTLSGAGLGFSAAAENLSVLKKVSAIVAKLYGASSEILEERVLGLNKVKYVLKVKDGEKILRDLGIVDFDEAGLRQIKDGFDECLIEEQCCAQTFVKAVFLGAGCVTLPEETNKGGYHLEFAFAGEEFAQMFCGVLDACGFVAKNVGRKGETVLYFKESDRISDMLAFLDATKSVFKLQNIIARRMLRNRANRQTNCISANIDKTVEAAEKQLKAIALLEKEIGLENLPETLRQAAELRRDNPSESLDELAEESGVSKSALNHRFRKIIEMAGKFYE